MSAPREIRVELGERSYPIRILAGGLGTLGTQLAPIGRRFGFVTDDRVDRLYGAAVREALAAAGLAWEWIVLPEGEETKTLVAAAEVAERLLSARWDRRTPVVALGGGVVGDLTGFVASVLLRGVPYIQVPTTLLAQVDSSVGGKTGVNSAHGKNLIGAFHQPVLVVAAMATLDTVDERDFRAGLAEVVKYGVIADPELFAWLEGNADAVLGRDPAALAHVVGRSCEIKADVVSRDERESGLRALLNFGHTTGHGVEVVTGYRRWRHGEAVAMGMGFAARLSRRLGLMDDGPADRVEGLLERLGLPRALVPVPRDAFLRAIAGDKKVAGATLKFVLMDQVGRARLHPLPVESLPALFDECAVEGLVRWA